MRGGRSPCGLIPNLLIGNALVPETLFRNRVPRALVPDFQCVTRSCHMFRSAVETEFCRHTLVPNQEIGNEGGGRCAALVNTSGHIGVIAHRGQRLTIDGRCSNSRLRLAMRCARAWLFGISSARRLRMWVIELFFVFPRSQVQLGNEGIRSEAKCPKSLDLPLSQLSTSSLLNTHRD